MLLEGPPGPIVAAQESRMPKKVRLSRLSQITRGAEGVERSVPSARPEADEGPDSSFRVLRAVLPVKEST
jgi:hypothetical protein